MKKRRIILLLMIVLIVGLGICGITQFNKMNNTKGTKHSEWSKKKDPVSMDWLEGRWFSDEWNEVYDFNQSNGRWLIKSGDGLVVLKNATLDDDSTDKKITFISKEGTEVQITKLSAERINFQQVAKEGLVGTTNNVEFNKQKN